LFRGDTGFQTIEQNHTQDHRTDQESKNTVIA
jgi:hypothetical protein